MTDDIERDLQRSFRSTNLPTAPLSLVHKTRETTRRRSAPAVSSTFSRWRLLAVVALALLLAAVYKVGSMSPSQVAGSSHRTNVGPHVAIAGDVIGSCMSIGNVDWHGASSNLSVPVGSTIAIALVVPLVDATDVFPWSPITSSDPLVVKPIALCSDTPTMASLPLRYSAFLALAPGESDLTASLLPSWSPMPGSGGSTDDLAPVAISVTVKAQDTRSGTP
jgi:hypothetical protein